MGMKKKTKGNILAQGLSSSGQIKAFNSNNEEAGAALNHVMSGTQEVEYIHQDIALADIRTNPDNEIFRQLDKPEDIAALAEDIKRNGLLHNLVVFPEKEDGKTVYVLLSGERRYKALDALQKQGDASWNIVKSCAVIVTPLSENEKKVLLYSANLQVRGGFGDEVVRRNAVGEFVACLQKAPYNLTEDEAKKAIKELAPDNTKNLNKDLRLQNELDAALRAMLDNKLLARSECDFYVRFSAEQQQRIAARFEKLFAVNCHGDGDAKTAKTHLEEKRDEVHNAFRTGLKEARDAATEDETEALFAEALKACDARLDEFAVMSAAYEDALQTDANDAEDIQREEARRQEEQTAQKKEQTFVQKAVLPVTDKIDKKLNSRSYKKGLNNQTTEVRRQDIAALEALIEKATQLKQLIEAAE